jgi:hypothetical protein
MKESMERTWCVLELLATRARIENALALAGYEIDAESSETIAEALHVFVDNQMLDLEDAEGRILEAFLEPLQGGRKVALN